ncbi:hypothetical protein RF11_03656 [Thelohanellus kitauei]|uniref:Uncharacterized protein n=1 Tax=Thelohanellus kitauei TaxID=669202 RepID=A0A0C2N7U5_THEKT|nr:hypothetical protein RF11_03656 [Thelohanellus kitauei]
MLKYFRRWSSIIKKNKKTSYYNAIYPKLKELRQKPIENDIFKIKEIDDPRYIRTQDSLDQLRENRHQDFRNRVLKPPKIATKRGIQSKYKTINQLNVFV